MRRCNGGTDLSRRHYSATTEPGEPLEGGKVEKTIWATVTLPKASRIVIDTLQTDFDTVLAVYTGNAVNHLTKVVSNDDTEGDDRQSGRRLNH